MVADVEVLVATPISRNIAEKPFIQGSLKVTLSMAVV